MAINDISLTAGMRSNLLSLQNTVTLLNRTQNRLSSGNKVNTALDNPTSYFTAQVLSARASKIDSLKDAMGQAIQTVTAADKGISGISALIEQAKGIAQSALSATSGSVYGTETITLNTVVDTNTIVIANGVTTTTFTAGASGTGTTTTLLSQTITVTSNNHLEAGDSISVGGLTFTAANASSTAISQYSMDMSVNTLANGNTVTVGGVVYTAVASSSETLYDSFKIAIHGGQAGDKYTVGGAQYTAVASVATTTYNHFTITTAGMSTGDTITVGAYTYVASTGNSTTEFVNITDLKALISANSPITFATSGVNGTTIDVTGADGHALVVGDVLTSRAALVDANTTVTTNTPGVGQYKIGATDGDTAANLKVAIEARQPGAFGVAEGAGGLANELTITAGTSALAVGSVTMDVNGSTLNVLTPTFHAHDNTAVGANQFVISGDAGMDATNLRVKINALQGSQYIAAGAGSTITIVGTGSTATSSAAVTDGGGHGITISTTVATTDLTSTLSQFQFAIGSTADAAGAAATATNLAGKMSTFFGAQYGVLNVGGTNLITITSGTAALTGTTVVAGTADATELTIASVNNVTTGLTYDATHFAVTGNNTTDAANLASKIMANTAAHTTAGFSATASGGVITLSRANHSVDTGDVVASATMVEAMVLPVTELTTLQNQYNIMLEQITALANDSGYKGKNLLTADTLSVQFEGTAAILDVVGSTATASGLLLTDATWAETVPTNSIEADITKLDTALTSLRSQATSLSGNLSIITVRQDFSTNMINVLTEGSNKLTLADTNEEGANMLMLQTRQSLSTTALSLSAQAAQSVLRLFQ